MSQSHMGLINEKVQELRGLLSTFLAVLDGTSAVEEISSHKNAEASIQAKSPVKRTRRSKRPAGWRQKITKLLENSPRPGFTVQQIRSKFNVPTDTIRLFLNGLVDTGDFEMAGNAYRIVKKSKISVEHRQGINSAKDQGPLQAKILGLIATGPFATRDLQVRCGNVMQYHPFLKLLEKLRADGLVDRKVTEKIYPSGIKARRQFWVSTTQA